MIFHCVYSFYGVILVILNCIAFFLKKCYLNINILCNVFGSSYSCCFPGWLMLGVECKTSLMPELHWTWESKTTCSSHILLASLQEGNRPGSVIPTSCHIRHLLGYSYFIIMALGSLSIGRKFPSLLLSDLELS